MSGIDLKAQFDSFWDSYAGTAWTVIQAILFFGAMVYVIIGVIKWLMSIKGPSNSGINLGGGGGGDQNFKQSFFIAVLIAVFAVIPKQIIGVVLMIISWIANLFVAGFNALPFI